MHRRRTNHHTHFWLGVESLRWGVSRRRRCQISSVSSSARSERYRLSIEVKTWTVRAPALRLSGSGPSGAARAHPGSGRPRWPDHGCGTRSRGALPVRPIAGPQLLDVGSPDSLAAMPVARPAGRGAALAKPSPRLRRDRCVAGRFSHPLGPTRELWRTHLARMGRVAEQTGTPAATKGIRRRLRAVGAQPVW